MIRRILYFWRQAISAHRDVLGVSLLAVAAAWILHRAHPVDAVINFDEGFHGGAAFTVAELVRHFLHLPTSGIDIRVLVGEFFNGFAVYPPLWTFVATLAVLTFGAHSAVLQAASLPFYVVQIVFTYWFVGRVCRNRLAGLAAAVCIATVPLVLIYSDSMMLEVPVLTAATLMIGGYYLYVEGLVSQSKRTLCFLAVTFAAGSLTKIVILPLVWGVLSLYMVLSSLVGWKTHTYRRYLTKASLLLGIVSFGSFALFLVAEQRIFHFNTLTFHLNQTQEGYAANPLVTAFIQAWQWRAYYLIEFGRMPWLTALYMVSMLGYAVYRRNRLGLLLLIWTGWTYFLFSALSPHETLVILPIYTPLTLALGLGFAELAPHLPRAGRAVLSVGILLIGIAQLHALPRSDAALWRTMPTGQTQAAELVAVQAATGDRVLTWYDGTTLALRLASGQKRLQLYNAVQGVCSVAMRDSFDWAVVTEQPPYPSDSDIATLQAAPWQVVAYFGQAPTRTIVYHNPKAVGPALVEAEQANFPTVPDEQAAGGRAVQLQDSHGQPGYWGCYRLLRYGTHTVTFRLRATHLDSQLADSTDVLQLQYFGVPGGEKATREVTAGELRRGLGYQDISFTVTRQITNRPGEFKVFFEHPATILLDTITVQ